MSCQGEVCFVDVSWSTRDFNFCSCDTLRGWQGSECSSYGPLTKFWIVSDSLLLIGLCLFLLPLEIRLLLRFEQINGKATVMFTVFALLVYLLAETFATAARLSGHVNPVLTTTEIEAYEGLKVPRLEIGSRACIAVGIFAMYQAGMTLVMVWIDVSLRSLRMTVESESKFISFRKVVRVSQVLISLFFCVAFIANYVVSSWLSVAMTVQLVGFYAFAWKQFDDLSKHLQPSSFASAIGKMKRCILHITITSNVLMIGTIVLLAPTVKGETYDNILLLLREKYNGGQITYLAVFFQVIQYGVYASALIISHHLLYLLSRREKSESSGRKIMGPSSE